MECQICKKMVRNYFLDKNETEIEYTGNIKLSIEIEGTNFFLKSTWLGCPSFNNSMCTDLNGDIAKKKINYCPECGKVLSVYRITKMANSIPEKFSHIEYKRKI